MALLFWDEIFGGDPAPYQYPGKDMPSDLFEAGFYGRREARFRERRDYLLAKDLSTELKTAYTRRFGNLFRMLPHKTADSRQGASLGLSQVVLDWSQVVLADLVEVAQHLEPQKVLAIIDWILRNVTEHRRGLPDLSAWNEQGFRFFEVKGPGDRERPGQQMWFRYLSGDLGIPCNIFRVVAAPDEVKNEGPLPKA
jgi:hypothetical protein